MLGRVADQDRVQRETAGMGEQVRADTGTDRAMAEHRNPHRLHLQTIAGALLNGGDPRCIGAPKGGDLDDDILFLGAGDGLVLHQTPADPGGFIIIELVEPFGIGDLGRIIGIDPVDILDQAHPVGAQCIDRHRR